MVDNPRIRKMRNLFAILSRPGTLEILDIAENGLKTDPSQHLPPSLTCKQLDARIADLVKAGILEERKGAYFQTAFGKMLCRKYLPRLEHIFMSMRCRDE